MVRDHWIAACGQTETPFRSRSGRRVLYCWQPSSGEHRYLDLDADLVLPRDFDPILDGTALDPTLPPKPLYLRFVLPRHRDKLGITLHEQQRDGSYLCWITWVTPVDGNYPLPGSLVSRSPTTSETLVGPSADRLTEPAPVADLAQAYDTVRVTLTAASGHDVVTRLPETLRQLARQVCEDLHVDPARIWPDVQLFGPATTPPAFNW
jgi:hypothetical protein